MIQADLNIILPEVILSLYAMLALVATSAFVLSKVIFANARVASRPARKWYVPPYPYKSRLSVTSLISSNSNDSAMYFNTRVMYLLAWV